MGSPTYNEWKADLRNYVLAGASVASFLGTRFYGAYLATLKDPVFPCSVFYPDAGDDYVHGIVQDFNINVAGFADTHFDDAGTAYQVVRDRLLNGIIRESSGGHFSIFPLGTPIEHYDELGRIYGVTGKFRIVRVQNVN